MGEVIYFNSENSKFKFQVKVVRYFKKSRYEDVLFEKAIIVLVNSENHRSRIHEFTDFIIYAYGKKRIKTQVDYAGKLVRFLNFIINEKVKKNFRFIDFDDINIFLQKIALDINHETILRYKKVIVEFYWYLSNKKWLYNIDVSDFIRSEVIERGAIIQKYDIPYFDIDINKNEVKKRNTHIMDYRLQAMLIEVAIEEVNIIAFGVALQIFGGIRLGEVVNISHSSIQCIGAFGRYGMLVNIDSRHFRLDLKGNQGKGYPKKIRKQQVISPYGILEYLYKDHIKKYKCNDESGAVFVNKNGDAMSYESYRYYFTKLKNIFLKRLRESDNPYLKVKGQVLEQTRWGSHIGRGIFTNNLSEYLTASELMIKRGDDNITSSNVYIEETKSSGEKYEKNSENAFREMIKFMDLKREE